MIAAEFPIGWTRRSLRSLHAGGVTNVSPSDYPLETFEYYSIPAYQEGTSPHYVKGSEILSQKLLIPRHCLLFGKLNPRVEKIWNVQSTSEIPRLASTEWLPIVPVAELDQDFGYFLLWSKCVLPVAQGLTSGSTPSRQRVEPTAFYDIELPIPPLGEQKVIAALLHRFQSGLSTQDQLISTACALKRAAMRTLFTRGLRGGDQRETEFGLVPDAWKPLSLDRCAEIQTGATKGRKFANDDAVEVPYLRVANVQDGHLDLTEMKKIRIRASEVDRYRLRPDVVVLTEGGDFDKLGRGFIWRGELDLCVHQNHIFAVRTDRDKLVPEFFAYLAQSAYGKAYFLKVAHKTTNLACINSTKLKAFPALVPSSLDEQRQIVSILDSIDRKIDLHRRKRAVLDELFRAVLHKLMTAEIRITDLDLSTLTPPVREVAA
jgi:type I restriction enzyme, S subunit